MWLHFSSRYIRQATSSQTKIVSFLTFADVKKRFAKVGPRSRIFFDTLNPVKCNVSIYKLSKTYKPSAGGLMVTGLADERKGHP